MIDIHDAHIAQFGGIAASTAADAEDCTVAFAEAQEYLVSKKGGTLKLGPGFYKSAHPWAPTVPIKLGGVGQPFSTAFSGNLATTGTTILWNGTDPDAIAFSLAQLSYGGASIKDLGFDLAAGATKPRRVLFINSSFGPTVKRFSARNFGEYGIDIDGPTATCSWADIDQIDLQTGGDGSCLSLQGTYGNACHNKFGVIRIQHAGNRNGILLRACDNNLFLGPVYINGSALNITDTTGRSVLVDPDQVPPFYGQPLPPSENLFVHLEAAGGGWFQPAHTPQSPATILNYNQAVPPVTNGSPLVYFSGLTGAGADANYDIGKRGARYQRHGDTGAYGPIIEYERISNSPAANDGLHVAMVFGRNSEGERHMYGDTYWKIIDPTDGSEDAVQVFRVAVGGVNKDIMQLGNGDFARFFAPVVGTGDISGATLSAGGVLAVDASRGVRYPSYSAAQLGSAAHAVNTAHKAKGKTVWDETNFLLMTATGAGATDAWRNGAATITPA